MQFEHPFVQSWFMFLGEILCLVTFKILLCSYSNRSVSFGILMGAASVILLDDCICFLLSQAPKPIASLMEGNRNVSPFYMFAPAMFDMCGMSYSHNACATTF